MNLKQYIPILEWFPHYTKSNFRGDLAAGLTVGVMVIPQGMAYGMLAGLPPIYGLYASLIPMILYGLLGTSRHLVIGPAAMVSLLVAAGVSELAEPASTEFIALTLTLTLCVGTLQFLMGMIRMGFLLNFLSHPVLNGFTSAAAIIIFFSQLKHLLGIDLSGSHFIHEITTEVLENFQDFHWPTILIGLGGMGIMILSKKISKKIPGALLALVIGILAVFLLGFNEQDLKIVGRVPEGLPIISIPDINLANLQKLLPIVLTISLIGILESVAIAKAIQAKHKDYDILPNQELRALGMSNLIGAFFQAYPSAGSFSRTAINDQVGAKTGISSIIAAALVGLTLLFLTPLFFYLPKAILASIIMVAVVQLIDYKAAVHLWHSDRQDFFMLLATLLATLFWGIEEGILLGIVLSLVKMIYKTTRPHIAELGQIPNTSFYKNVHRFSNLIERDDILVIRFDSQLYFANISYFKESLTLITNQKGVNLKLIVLNAEGIPDLDSSAMNILKDLVTEYRKEGIMLWFSNVIGPVRDIMYRGNLINQVGKEYFFVGVQNAVDYYEENKENEFQKYTMQTNVPEADPGRNRKFE